MPAERIVWTVGVEFAVRIGAEWEACCASCLPLLVRRSLRRNIPPAIMPTGGAACTIRQPHPAPTTPPAGYSCPRPLTGTCLDDTCDHD